MDIYYCYLRTQIKLTRFLPRLQPVGFRAVTAVILIAVTLYRRAFVITSDSIRPWFRAVKPPLVRCTAENTHSYHYET